MEEKQAVEMLMRGLNVAAEKGAFSIKDAALLFNAVTVINKFITDNQPKVDEVKVPTEKPVKDQSKK